ncbi:hypothetical protein MPTK1_4g10730 [Marchantia polymorpha subsp. ruderalis]|uniref:Ubiquitin-like domain-containing protein n=2 Tax=Marchantia polymorpha TaxID=3197 RepID=A0A176W8P6_MARPO|nr:hypothetical protein AXG93_3036s1180 [Marchantia polymorpha subsp. ruderalis]PTQ46373.1 hypothetical protein MARPO_0011s0059 [Marchantia polymorpha]BBN08337.1 hypothetical protein Mp_4g10730 [Marchantia polymorpha subsp. ruderalis]|eukprot:PTQ46373.1 hypothetical protein MARPO_0011s0059 [Marchantia polymorpha]
MASKSGSTRDGDDNDRKNYITIKLMPYYMSDCCEVIMMTDTAVDVNKVVESYSQIHGKDSRALAFVYFGKVMQSGTIKENGLTEGCEVHVVPAELLQSS